MDGANSFDIVGEFSKGASTALRRQRYSRLIRRGNTINDGSAFILPSRQLNDLTCHCRSGDIFREIQTANFLDPRFANVSAVVQGHQKDMFEKDLVLSTVHNPLASNPLPTSLFGTCKEFVAEERGDEYEIKDVAMNP